MLFLPGSDLHDTSASARRRSIHLDKRLLDSQGERDLCCSSFFLLVCVTSDFYLVVHAGSSFACSMGGKRLSGFATSGNRVPVGVETGTAYSYVFFRFLSIILLFLVACFIVFEGRAWCSGRASPPVTERSQVRVAVSSHCTS